MARTKAPGKTSAEHSTPPQDTSRPMDKVVKVEGDRGTEGEGDASSLSVISQVDKLQVQLLDRASDLVHGEINSLSNNDENTTDLHDVLDGLSICCDVLEAVETDSYLACIAHAIAHEANKRLCRTDDALHNITRAYRAVKAIAKGLEGEPAYKELVGDVEESYRGYLLMVANRFRATNAHDEFQRTAWLARMETFSQDELSMVGMKRSDLSQDQSHLSSLTTTINATDDINALRKRVADLEAQIADAALLATPMSPVPLPTRTRGSPDDLLREQSLLSPLKLGSAASDLVTPASSAVDASWSSTNRASRLFSRVIGGRNTKRPMLPPTPASVEAGTSAAPPQLSLPEPEPFDIMDRPISSASSAMLVTVDEVMDAIGDISDTSSSAKRLSSYEVEQRIRQKRRRTIGSSDHGHTAQRRRGESEPPVDRPGRIRRMASTFLQISRKDRSASDGQELY